MTWTKLKLTVAALAVSTAVGDSLQWDANTEPDIAGYKVYVMNGTNGTNKPVIYDVGKATIFQLDTTNSPPGQTNNYFVTAYNTSGLESGPSGTLQYASPPSTNVPVVITVQPVNQVLDPGSLFQISLAATGTPPISYFWYHNFVPLLTQTSSNVTVQSVQSADVGFYFCMVSNIGGRTISRVVSLTLTTNWGKPPSAPVNPQVAK